MTEGLGGDVPLVTPEKFYSMGLPGAARMHEPTKPPLVARADSPQTPANAQDAPVSHSVASSSATPSAERRSARLKRRDRPGRRCVEAQDCNAATALFGGLSAGALLNVLAFVPLCVCMGELDRGTKLFYAGGVLVGSMVVLSIVLAYLFMNS